MGCSPAIVGGGQIGCADSILPLPADRTLVQEDPVLPKSESSGYHTYTHTYIHTHAHPKGTGISVDVSPRIK